MTARRTLLLKLEPAPMSVQAGVPVTFVVTNSGATDHKFYLGDEAAQAEHENDLAEMGGMAHDEPERVAVKPGGTRELTYTFAEAGRPWPVATSLVTTVAA